MAAESWRDRVLVPRLRAARAAAASHNAERLASKGLNEEAQAIVEEYQRRKRAGLRQKRRGRIEQTVGDGPGKPKRPERELRVNYCKRLSERRRARAARAMRRRQRRMRRS